VTNHIPGIQGNPVPNEVYTGEKTIYTVDKTRLDSMLNELWEKCQEINRDSSQGIHATLHLRYKDNRESPTGEGSLRFDDANQLFFYTGFDSLEGRRFQLMVDSPGEYGGYTPDSLMAIMKVDDKNAVVHTNSINTYVDPDPFYDIVSNHAHSEKAAKKNAPKYVSKIESLIKLSLYKLTRLKRETNF